MENRCKQFLNNPSVNPYTGRNIKFGGKVYNDLVKSCGQPYTSINHQNSFTSLNVPSTHPPVGVSSFFIPPFSTVPMPSQRSAASIPYLPMPSNIGSIPVQSGPILIPKPVLSPITTSNGSLFPRIPIPTVSTNINPYPGTWATGDSPRQFSSIIPSQKISTPGQIRTNNILVIRDIFEKINPQKITSQYVKSMILYMDNDFINFLSNLLDNDTVRRWSLNPNDDQILDEIMYDGWAFYNYQYLGNPGYEWVEPYIFSN